MLRYISYTLGLVIGSVLLLGGAFYLNHTPHFLVEKIQANLPLVNGTEAYDRYTQSKVPLDVRMYLFNVTNSQEVIETGAKPILQEVGPFTFTEKRKKNVVNIASDNTTLDYRLIRTFFFKEKDSPRLDSIITLPNAPAISAVFSAKLKKKDEEGLADPVEAIKDYLINETIYKTATAEEWLFKGIKLDWLESLNADGVYVDDQPKDNTFGFYYKKNETWDDKADGTVTVSTGVDGNFTNLGKVLKWNGKTSLSFWKSTCNSLKGTDGQFFHPFIKKTEQLHIFAPDLCRSLSIDYQKTVSLRTIELYRYGIAKSFFKSIDHDESTMCYCVKKDFSEKKNFCHLKGLTDVSSCRKKPIVLSTPHFYKGSEELNQDVIGLNPNENDHDTFIDIEPMTGAVMRVRRRLQVNVEMRREEALISSKKIKSTGLIHPFVWLDQSITIPDELAEKFENRLTRKVKLIRMACYTAIIVGPLVLIATLIFICLGIKSEGKKLKSNQKSGVSEYRRVQLVMKNIDSKAETKE